MGCVHVLKPFLLLALVVVLNHGASSVSAADVIHSTCKRLPNSVHHKFCVDSLEADPKSRKAKDVPALALAVTDLALTNATHTLSKISSLEKRSRPDHDPKLKEHLGECSRLYADTVQQFRKASKFVAKKEYKDAITHLKHSADKLLSCDAFLSKKGHRHVLKKESRQASQLALISEYIVESLAEPLRENNIRRLADQNGTSEFTPLKKHVAFFDRNGDGLIYPSETYQGFRAIGASVALSLTASAFINGFLGPKTQPGKGFTPSSLLLPIYVENIKKGKHGCDTGAYDSEGRFVPSKFEEIFTKHAKTNPNALTEDELTEMLNANKQPDDEKGALAASTEWKILYKLFKDQDGLLQKDTVRDVYDGSLFYNKEKEISSSTNKV